MTLSCMWPCWAFHVQFCVLMSGIVDLGGGGGGGEKHLRACSECLGKMRGG